MSGAFNNHDVNKLKSLFADDVEFYQDNEGLARYEQTMRDFESMFAQGNNMTRELVGNTLEVYPIKDLRCDRNRRTPVLPRGER